MRRSTSLTLAATALLLTLFCALPAWLDPQRVPHGQREQTFDWKTLAPRQLIAEITTMIPDQHIVAFANFLQSSQPLLLKGTMSQRTMLEWVAVSSHCQVWIFADRIVLTAPDEAASGPRLLERIDADGESLSWFTRTCFWWGLRW
jgi:hypothetical protein